MLATTELEREGCFTTDGLSFTGFSTGLATNVSGRVRIFGTLDDRYAVTIKIVEGTLPDSQVGHTDPEGNDDPHGDVVFTVPCIFAQEARLDGFSTVAVADDENVASSTGVYVEVTVPTDEVPADDTALTAVVTVSVKQ